MTPDELKAQEAEILAARARDFTQQIQATPVSDEQKKKGGEVAEEVADLALDLADTDFVDLALKGVSKAVSGIGELASGALDMAGTATSVVGTSPVERPPWPVMSSAELPPLPATSSVAFWKEPAIF